MDEEQRPAERGATVMLTRSAAQGAAFARALAEECAQNGVGECRVLFAPLQQARTVPSTEELRGILALLESGSYAWVSFTSAHTVRACAELWVAEFERPAPVDPVADLAATDSATVLVLEGSNARPTLHEGLKNLGWSVTSRVLYDMVPAEQVEPGELSLAAARALVQGNDVDAPDPETPAPDVLVVTAPSRLHALLDGAPAIAPEAVPPVVAIGASTASACRALNLRYVQADSPSPQDLARAAAVSLM